MEMRRWKLRLLRVGLALYMLALNVAGRVPGARYVRFLSLEDRAKRALRRSDHKRAAVLARELLTLADDYKNDWNYGNAVHQAHLVLGRVALASGDVATAREELLLAGRTPGSPQLLSFGPSMRLALELLRAGERGAVLEYFGLCRRFWQLGAERLAEWTTEVERDREPSFGANLRY